MNVEIPRPELQFEKLSDLKDLKAGDRIRVKNGPVYEVGSDLGIKGRKERMQTYMLVRIQGADNNGKGGRMTEIFTNTLNWPMDTLVQRIPQ